MSWDYVKIESVCTLIDGDRGKSYPKKSDFYDEGDCLFLDAGNVTKDGFDFSSCSYINAEKDALLRAGKLSRNDVVLTTRGTLGNVGWYSESIPFSSVRINSGMIILRVDQEILPSYLYYCLRSPYFQSLINGVRSGSAQPQLPAKTLKQMEIPLPPLDAQNHIASILMVYDKLIENNRRQIALLEEAAQRLYKEWFVDLRFPGHEDTEVIDGLPSGWAKCELGAVVYQSGNAEKKSNRENYSHYLPIDSIPSKSITCWESDVIENASSSLVAFRRDDFIFGAMRPYFHKVIIAPYPGLTRTTCFVVNVKDADYWAYVFALLTFGDCVRYATSISVGTTMPYVRWEDLRHMPIVVPDKELTISFGEHFSIIRLRIEMLYRQITEAREARNRLLPKLMSGEIEV